MSPKKEAERRRSKRCPEKLSYWGEKEAREWSRKVSKEKGKGKERKCKMEERDGEREKRLFWHANFFRTRTKDPCPCCCHHWNQQ